MKKWIAIVMVLAILATAVACQSKEPTPGTDPSDPAPPASSTTTPVSEPEKTTTTPITEPDTTPPGESQTTPIVGDEALKEKLKSIVKQSGVDNIEMGRNYTPIKQEDAAFFIGAESFEGKFKDCIALEPEMNIDAFALGLFELEVGADVKAFAKEVYEKANIQKWICVGAEDKYVAMSGQYVLFLMTTKADIAKIAQAAGFESVK